MYILSCLSVPFKVSETYFISPAFTSYTYFSLTKETSIFPPAVSVRVTPDGAFVISYSSSAGVVLTTNETSVDFSPSEPAWIFVAVATLT